MRNASKWSTLATRRLRSHSPELYEMYFKLLNSCIEMQWTELDFRLIGQCIH